jgi:hypothetical protein
MIPGITVDGTAPGIMVDGIVLGIMADGTATITVVGMVTITADGMVTITAGITADILIMPPADIIQTDEAVLILQDRRQEIEMALMDRPPEALREIVAEYPLHALRPLLHAHLLLAAKLSEVQVAAGTDKRLAALLQEHELIKDRLPVKIQVFVHRAVIPVQQGAAVPILHPLLQDHAAVVRAVHTVAAVVRVRPAVAAVILQAEEAVPDHHLVVVAAVVPVHRPAVAVEDNQIKPINDTLKTNLCV